MTARTNAPHELLRLAIPRRVYTQSHIDYVVEAILEVNEHRERIRGLAIESGRPTCATLAHGSGSCD